MSSFEDKQKAIEDMLKALIELLPDAYNKEVTDTNYYKLLRAFALQLSDAKIEIEEIGKNRYLETATTPQAIHDNFGYLVQLKKNPDWDTEKYRNLIKGVIQSLLKGPTKQSMIEGFKLFTNFKTNIYELFKDSDKIDKTAYQGYNPKFTFAIEIEKPVDEYVDQEILLRDVNYVVNIIKPAHTLTINIITIIAEENYRRYYRIDRKIGDFVEKCIERKIQKYISNNLAHTFENEAIDYAHLNGITVEEAKEALRQISNRMSIAEYEEAIENLANEKYNNYLTSLKKCDIPLETLNCFRIDARVDMRGTLELKWLQELLDHVFKEEYIDYTKEQINEMVEAKKAEIIQLCENDYVCNPSDLSDAEWYQKALEMLKWDSLRRKILIELGGEPAVRKECNEAAEKYRQDLEKNYVNNPPYCGMDEVLFEGTLNNSEGTYGWHHIGYDTQFITTIDKNVCKIGGARLIGPRYVLNDLSQIDIYQSNEDIRTKPFEDDFDEVDTEIQDQFHEVQETFDDIDIDFISEEYKEVEEERHIDFEKSLSEKVKFIYQHNPFIFENSEMPEEDLILPDRVEIAENFEIDLSEIFPPVLENVLIEPYFEFFESVDFLKKSDSFTTNVSELNKDPLFSYKGDIYENKLEFVEHVNFFKKPNPLILNKSKFNEFSLYDYEGDIYDIKIEEFSERFHSPLDEGNGRMFRIVNGLEVEIEARAI